MLAVAINEWFLSLSAIENISEQVLVKAADYCRDNLEWPPSIKEFRDICNTFLDKKLSHTEKLLSEHRSIKKSEMEVGEKSLLEIREILKSKKKFVKDESKHPIWDYDTLNRLHRKFDRKVFEYRKTYLKKLTEESALNLNTVDFLDRNSYLCEDMHRNLYPRAYEPKTDQDISNFKGKKLRGMHVAKVILHDEDKF